ncbi:MFS general substrate transporter [Hypoxylon sp. FL0543]|nr:MFS general substrate transporter [Hypoxylon sp. FL0543]
MEQFQPQDGGLLAWSQVIASFFINFCTLGLGNSFGAFQSYYEHNLLDSYTSSDISWIGTTQGFLLCIIGIFSGPLYDRGYIRSLLYVGTALNVLGLVATSFANQFQWIILSYGVALGLGCGVLYVPGQAIIQAYFTKRGALATGISMSGSSIGGIVYPVLLRRLEQQVGFAWTCRIFAIINACLLAISCLLIRPRKTPETEPKSAPFNWQILFDWKIYLLGGAALLLNITVDVPFFFVPTFVQDRLDISPVVGDSLLAGMNASSLAGRLFLGWVAGHFRPLNIWHYCILAASILLYCWSSIGNLAGMIAFVIVYGAIVGGLIALIPSSIRDIWPDQSVLGTRIGLVEGFQGIGYLVGSPIAGAIMESPAGYLGVSLFCGSLYVVQFLMVGIFTWRRPVIKRQEIPGNFLPLETLHDVTGTREGANQETV